MAELYPQMHNRQSASIGLQGASEASSNASSEEHLKRLSNRLMQLQDRLESIEAVALETANRVLGSEPSVGGMPSDGSVSESAIVRIFDQVDVAFAIVDRVDYLAFRLSSL